MFSREDAQRSAVSMDRSADRSIGRPVDHGSPPVAGMGQATVTALWALAGCALLITVGTAMSICWAIHPLLTLAAVAVVIWLLFRLIGHLFG